MRLIRSCVLPIALLVIAGCAGPERTALMNDGHRVAEQARTDASETTAAIERYARSQSLLVEPLSVDAKRFLAWRRQQWWALNSETAWLIDYEWDAIAKLSADVARHHGYEIKNFPKERDAIIRFFARADPEWRALVQDVSAFVEYQHHRTIPLRKDLADFYNNVHWELAGAKREFADFMAWRSREAEPLAEDLRTVSANALVDWDALQQDLWRFRTNAVVNGRRLVADLGWYWRDRNEGLSPPRLIDDVNRVFARSDRDWRQLAADIRLWASQTPDDLFALSSEVRRWCNDSASALALLSRETEEFLDVYNREITPLKDEERRFMRREIAAGHRLMSDIADSLAQRKVERERLAQDADEFVSYGAVEWEHFKASLHRHGISGGSLGFGSEIVPLSTSRPAWSEPVPTMPRATVR